MDKPYKALRPNSVRAVPFAVLASRHFTATRPADFAAVDSAISDVFAFVKFIETWLESFR